MKTKFILVSVACACMLSSGLRAEASNTPNVVFWGSEGAVPAVPADLTNAVQLAMGGARPGIYDVLLADSTVRGSSQLTNIASICEYNRGIIVLHGGGSVSVVGEQGDVTPVPELTNIVAVASGEERIIALKNDGTVIAWGTSAQPVPSAVSNVTAVAAKKNYSMALKNDGTVVAWGGFGNNLMTNVPAAATQVIAIAVGEDYYMDEGSTCFLALRSNGTIVAWGGNYQNQLDGLDQLTSVKAISAGPTYVLVLKDDGTVVMTGTGPINVPTDLDYVVSLGSGLQNHVCGVVVDPTRAGTRPSNVYISPANQNLIAGTNAYFTASALGSGTLLYQWNFEGSPIPGATNKTLTLRNISVTSSGAYTVDVSNGAGSATSPPATLNVFLGLNVLVTPTLEIKGEIGSTIRIEYINFFGSPVWQLLNTVTLTNNVQYYYDTSPTNQARFYRLVTGP